MQQNFFGDGTMTVTNETVAVVADVSNEAMAETSPLSGMDQIQAEANKRVYVVTVGSLNNGANPCHDNTGDRQLEALKPAIARLTVTAILAGTGKRHGEIKAMVQGTNPVGDDVIGKSFLCGGAEYELVVEKEKRILLASGDTVDRAKVHTVAELDHDIAWAIVAQLQDGVVLCSDQLILKALGLEEISWPGRLYELTPATKSGRMIA